MEIATGKELEEESKTIEKDDEVTTELDNVIREEGENPDNMTEDEDRTTSDEETQKKEEEDVILVLFSREDSYKFVQDDMFQLDTRIHYENSITNPPTNIIRLRMNATLFESGEEVNA